MDKKENNLKEALPCEFTCKTCGGHKLTVFHVWTILAGPDTESWQEWGPLDTNHLWHFKFKEKIEKEKVIDDDPDPWGFGEYAKDSSSSKPKDFEIYEPEGNPGNDKFFVNCTSCDREIEFGWSEPNRGGGIFPVECSDFNPEGVWPEPRYLDSWQQKNWLIREDDQP